MKVLKLFKRKSNKDSDDYHIIKLLKDNKSVYSYYYSTKNKCEKYINLYKALYKFMCSISYYTEIKCTVENNTYKPLFYSYCDRHLNNINNCLRVMNKLNMFKKYYIEYEIDDVIKNITIHDINNLKIWLNKFYQSDINACKIYTNTVKVKINNKNIKICATIYLNKKYGYLILSNDFKDTVQFLL